MSDLLRVMIAPFVACMVLVALFAYLGIHVIAREVIFVDLSLAQMAALGSTCALLFGVAPDSLLGHLFALGATTLGALIFAATRTRRERRRVPQEAIIGIVFVVASAAAILVADRAPTGSEIIKDVLVGSILWVDWPTVLRLALVFLSVGVFHWFLRRRFLTISLHEETAEERGWRIKWWDFLFYASFALVVTSSVHVCGVLLIFVLLVAPSVFAAVTTITIRGRLILGWLFGLTGCVAGLWLSFVLDTPSGATVVATLGLLLVVFGVIRLFQR